MPESRGHTVYRVITVASTYFITDVYMRARVREFTRIIFYDRIMVIIIILLLFFFFRPSNRLALLISTARGCFTLAAVDVCNNEVYVYRRTSFVI